MNVTASRFASSMLELWNLMDTPLEEQQMFQNVTCNIAASEHEITEPNTLSIDFLSYVSSLFFRYCSCHCCYVFLCLSLECSEIVY